MAPSTTPDRSSPTTVGKTSRLPSKNGTPPNGSPSGSPTQTRTRGIRFGLPKASPPTAAAKATSPPSEPTSASSASSVAVASPASATTSSPPPITLSSPPLSAGASPTGSTSKLVTSKPVLGKSVVSKLPVLQPPVAKSGSASTTPPESPPKSSSTSIDSPSTPYHVSEVDSGTAYRTIRTVVHNGFGKIQEEAEDEPFGPGVPKMRTYFVAADLSSEGAYAIEWTIGTFLRDGDTLLVIHAVDSTEPEGGKLGGALGGGAKTGSREGTPTGSRLGIRTEALTGIPIGSGGAAVRDTQDAIRKLNRRRSSGRNRAGSLPGRARSSSDSATQAKGPDGIRFSRSPSVDSVRPKTWMEIARLKSIATITSICTRSLNKRDVKVQIAIEVIHCRSPKHMITEAIDTLEPTLVILGSRGRSALKGVLLGSFSNYLVTKSSVPVIVARKRPTTKPQTPHKEPPRPHLRALPTNRVDSPNRLVTARID